MVSTTGGAAGINPTLIERPDQSNRYLGKSEEGQVEHPPRDKTHPAKAGSAVLDSDYLRV